MSQPENASNGTATSLEKIQQDWHDLTLRVAQLETQRTGLEAENRQLRLLLERVIEHRQKSHGELITLLTTLVSKLPINDIGVIVSRLMEHNMHVIEVSASLTKGKIEDQILQPALLKQLDKAKRDLTATLKPAVDELIKLEAPLEPGMLQSLVTHPENFYLPAVVRASRGFVKGQLPRERILREFGESAQVFFKDVTTDIKFNPRPKPDEIMFVFQPEFEKLLAQHPPAGSKRDELLALFHKVRASKEASEVARAQKNAFLRLSFVLELLHYYNNQNTESPDVVFAQRLPPLIEQLVVVNEQTALDEKLIQQAEALLAFIIAPDYRKSVVNNLGKGGGSGRTLRFALAFRTEKLADIDPLTIECVKHLVPLGKPPKPETLTAVLSLFNPEMQTSVIRALAVTDRIRKEEAEVLAKAVASQLGLREIENRLNEKHVISPEREHRQAWEIIRNLITSRASPAEIIAAIRKRMGGRYDADEVKACWLVLTENDPMIFVRVFCLLPYLPNGQSDPLARAMMETFITRLVHEKYAPIYAKVLGALKNLYKVKSDSPALVNFVTFTKWVDTEAAKRLARDIGMAAT